MSSKNHRTYLLDDSCMQFLLEMAEPENIKIRGYVLIYYNKKFSNI